MATTIDIDIGGTFTDCVVISDERIVRKKSPTTRHNLSVGFRKVIEESGRALGLNLDQLLSRTDMIRYSTTLAMNTLIERKGPRLGLITTAGHEHVLYIGRSRQWADGKLPSECRDMSKIRKPELLIPLDLTVGIRERIDSQGNVVEPLNPEEVREKVQVLVDRGVRGFVVCLLWSFQYPQHEQQIRKIIEEEYPDVYLGHMPVMLSCEVHPKWHEYPRTNVTVLNSYLQSELTDQLRGMADELRDRGYKRPLMVINNAGGMAKIARTRAIDTYAAGPVAGLTGAAHLARQYGIENVVVSDMGGTSFDFGVISKGRIDAYNEWPVIDQFATETSMIEVKTLGAGGGSIARVNREMGNLLEVGPASAGSNPGPACYNLGGTEPTVTDADLVLGYLDPKFFLAGRMRLDPSKSRKVIEEKIAKPLGLSVEEAALAIRRVVGANMGNTIAKELYMRGHNPRDFTLFAYGGAGPGHCCEYGAHLGTRRILTSPFAGVFCALGGSTMDLVHVYERSHHIQIYKAANPVGERTLDIREPFNQVVEKLREIAVRDMEGEGFAADSVQFMLDIEMRYAGQQNLTRIHCPVLAIDDPADADKVFDAFNSAYEARFSSLGADRNADVEMENFYLTARVPLHKPPVATYASKGPDAARARKGERLMYWKGSTEHRMTDVYDAALLESGNRIIGPAVIEAEDTTFVVNPGWTFTVDLHLNGVLEQVGATQANDASQSPPEQALVS